MQKKSFLPIEKELLDFLHISKIPIHKNSNHVSYRWIAELAYTTGRRKSFLKLVKHDSNSSSINRLSDDLFRASKKYLDLK